MSPFIVTTKRLRNEADVPAPYRDWSRLAVATLEEDELRRVLGPEWERMGLDVDLALDMVVTTQDEGLPCALVDGPVIEVEPTNWTDLAEPYTPSAHMGEQAILDAYNARQS